MTLLSACVTKSMFPQIKVSEDQADASITFDDGSTLEKRIEYAIGSWENPMTEAELKFMDVMTRYWQAEGREGV